MGEATCFISRPFWKPIPFRDWEERKAPEGAKILQVVGSGGQRLERYAGVTRTTITQLRGSAFAVKVCLDEVMERFNVANTGLTLVDLFNLQP
jgi:hypothetical protein